MKPTNPSSILERSGPAGLHGVARGRHPAPRVKREGRKVERTWLVRKIVLVPQSSTANRIFPLSILSSVIGLKVILIYALVSIQLKYSTALL